MTRSFLWFVAASFLAFGLTSLVAPSFLASWVGISGDASGTTDLRATYGGFQLGFGAFLAWSASAPERHATALWALALVIGGVGLCRSIGLVVDGQLNSFHAIGLSIEFPVAAISLWLLRSERREAGVAT